MDTIEIALNDKDWCDECDEPQVIVEFHDEHLPNQFPTAKYVMVLEMDCSHQILIPVGIPKYFHNMEDYDA